MQKHLTVEKCPVLWLRIFLLLDFSGSSRLHVSVIAQWLTCGQRARTGQCSASWTASSGPCSVPAGFYMLQHSNTTLTHDLGLSVLFWRPRLWPTLNPCCCLFCSWLLHLISSTLLSAESCSVLFVAKLLISVQWVVQAYRKMHEVSCTRNQNLQFSSSSSSSPSPSTSSFIMGSLAQTGLKLVILLPSAKPTGMYHHNQVHFFL